MAGSWEPLLFRVRRDGSAGYTPTQAQREAYEREHSPEMVARLKSLGVNFVMMHCYKGFGLSAERESMEDAVRFARLCHEQGLHVGVYVYSGAFGWELFFKEVPQARDWVVLNSEGKPATYGSATYRYYWNRNHPEAQGFYRGIVQFAVRDIGTDLLHFDNYSVGPGSDQNSAERFRRFLREGFSPSQLSQTWGGLYRQHLAGCAGGILPPSTAGRPRDCRRDGGVTPMTGPPDNLLRRSWLEFSCRSLTDSYHDMSRYARSLRRDILVECNPGGVGENISPPVHHGELLRGGEAFWDEGPPPGYQNGRLQSRIRTYKVARRMNNMAFCYATNPLEMAESMAFNLDCLGCICWFEYGEIVEKPGSKKPVSMDIAPFVRFFHGRRELVRDATVVADVAVLRSFPSQVFAERRFAKMTADAEQALILKRVPFQVIYDSHLNELARYRVLLLAGCVALSDRQVEQIFRYVQQGGGLCIVGPAGTHDEWMVPRDRSPFQDTPCARRIRTVEGDSVVNDIWDLCDGKMSLTVEGPDGLCAELTEQKRRRFVHLVNYRSDGPAQNVVVRLRLPDGKKAKSVTLASPLRDSDATISFEERTGIVEFQVPSVQIYEIATVAFK